MAERPEARNLEPVETAIVAAILREPLDKRVGGALQTLLLSRGYGKTRTAEIRPLFNFDERKPAAADGDDVDFTGMRLQSPRKDAVALQD